MGITKRPRNIIRISILFSLIFVSNIFIILSNDLFRNSQIINDNIKNDDYEQNPLKPKTNFFGEAEWWDHSFQYRILINITNPYPFDIQNYAVNVSFNYADLHQEGKIQEDLDDIRIVENGTPRKYYVQKDFPSVGMATVWFDTDILAGITETDTYLYFGNDGTLNNEAIDPIDSFGWIKNGDFELDISTEKKYNPYGWTFSHEPVNNVVDRLHTYPDAYNYSSTSYNGFSNRLTDDEDGDHRIGNGNYAYKWGVDASSPAGNNVHDYAGTLFSYPFKVPIINGGQISLKIFRNIRTYRFQRINLNPGIDHIEVDGYFIRVLNASDYNSDPDSHSDDNIDQSHYENYAEVYDGYSRQTGVNWNNDKDLIQLHDGVTWVHTDKIIRSTDGDGELTGYIELNLTNYMGDILFFEIGAWGEESDVKNAFIQIDDLRFNYILTPYINEVQERTSEITIIARDIDGIFVPNAEVFIFQDEVEITNGITSPDHGSIAFEQLLNGEYNITVNYSIGAQEAEVYNSAELGILHNFDGTIYIVEIQLDLWTIDFEFTDSDGIPFDYGYLNIRESKIGVTIQTINLNSEGQASFRWLNAPSYYYELYYDNKDYDNNPFLLNQSNYIYRSDYESIKVQTHTLNVITKNLAPSGESRYLVNERIYTNSSTNFNNRKIIKADVSLSGMNDQIVNVSIYYIDQDNSTGIGDENLIYFEDGYGYGEDSDFISLDILSIDNDKLKTEKFEVYGLNIIVHGGNSSTCNGVITLNLNETCHVYNETELSRLNIRVININKLFPLGQPLDALIKVEDELGQPLVNLTSIATRDGYTFGEMNGFEIPFWFFKNRNYTFRIDVLDYVNIEFNITNIDPDDGRWIPTGEITSYELQFNMSMTIEFNVIFETEVNMTYYDTAFYNFFGIQEVQWGENLTFSLVFQYTNDYGDNWDPVPSQGSTCTITITLQSGSKIIFMKNLKALGNGNYTLVINSSVLSAGYDEQSYIVKITGNMQGYPPPNEIYDNLKIIALPTDMSSHDYNTLIEKPSNEFEAEFDELINITIKYFDYRTNQPLKNALLSFEWLSLPPEIIQLDSINNGYYTFTLDTSDALSIGTQQIKLIAKLENYTTSTLTILLSIKERMTSLNGYDAPYSSLSINKKIWIEDKEYFLFSYMDVKTGQLIGEINLDFYTWYKLYENGSRNLGYQGTGRLIHNENKTYTLDFNTGLKEDGEYDIDLIIKKDNYLIRTASIKIEIMLRYLDFEFNSPKIKENQINVAHGKPIDFEISVIDKSRGNIELLNATVILMLDSKNYTLTELNGGIYSITLETSQYEAFFAPNIILAKFIIQKADFTTEIKDINIIIEMEEIFPGMPTFYFILIISANIIIGIASVFGAMKYRSIHKNKIEKITNQYLDILKLNYLLLSERKTGLNIYERSFTGKKIDPTLISGYLNAFKIFGVELAGSYQKSQIAKLEYQKIKIIMADYRDIRTTLIFNEEPSDDFFDLVTSFSYEIESNYKKELKNFMGDRRKFKDIEKIIDKHLNITFILPLDIYETEGMEYKKDQEDIINQIKQIKKKNKISYFFSSFLMENQNFDLKTAKIITKLIKNRILRPIEKDIKIKEE